MGFSVEGIFWKRTKHFFSYGPLRALGLFLRTVYNNTVSADVGIEPRTVAVYALTIRAANHCATSHLVDEM
jgi:hypothetical protein